MEQPNSKETVIRNEDGIISLTKLCILVPIVLIVSYIVRDLIYNVALDWQHVVLFAIMFLGGIMYRIDGKRLGARLTTLSINSSGVNVEMIKDTSLLNHLNKEAGIETIIEQEIENIPSFNKDIP
jgi:hypothetical protein